MFKDKGRHASEKQASFGNRQEHWQLLTLDIPLPHLRPAQETGPGRLPGPLAGFGQFEAKEEKGSWVRGA